MKTIFLLLSLIFAQNIDSGFPLLIKNSSRYSVYAVLVAYEKSAVYFAQLKNSSVLECEPGFSAWWILPEHPTTFVPWVFVPQEVQHKQDLLLEVLARSPLAEQYYPLSADSKGYDVGTCSYLDEVTSFPTKQLETYKATRLMY